MNSQFRSNGHNNQVWQLKENTSLPLKDAAANSAHFSSFTSNYIYCTLYTDPFLTSQQHVNKLLWQHDGWKYLWKSPGCNKVAKWERLFLVPQLFLLLQVSNEWCNNTVAAGFNHFNLVSTKSCSVCLARKNTTVPMSLRYCCYSKQSQISGTVGLGNMHRIWSRIKSISAFQTWT